ncbi:hypothetical protein BX616_006743 [Lobosporangium transversale]|uniref:Protein-serine/threonine kinase n=1 Tax=Lobosporangium transversale TaxID=64571 RepID=A0A1Y2GNG5_9FUNG|nr:histidine kinase-like ATPase [Lobosporangium transversale]KAF9915171.1 hypothetical protein BX616_006743 [Lobosporangium transversale]ORZ16721.1 histidine kinase-like ATPase [Lobosporangium transversale]|eukprot:XP_021881656.1 histidine kinase-like ATPase [Lobosporangium transversale]
MPKPSSPQLEKEFTMLLRDLGHRHKIKMLALSQGFKEFTKSLQAQFTDYRDDATSTKASLQSTTDNKRLLIDPQMDRDIQAYFDRFYSINLSTQLLIGEQLALRDHELNLAQRVNLLSTSQRAIKDAQRVCSVHYGQPAPSVLIQTFNPDITMTYVDDFLHRTIFELLKNAMRATCETHLSKDGNPISLGMSKLSSLGTSSKLPPITLALVDGSEDVTIKITDQGGGIALSQLDKIWSYMHFATSVTPKAENERLGNEQGVGMLLTDPNSNALASGLADETKGYLNLPLSRSGHGLPLSRLIARYFGGDLSLVSMEGYGTSSYLSLYRDDNHLENFPEMDEEVLGNIDIFVNKLLDEYPIDLDKTYADVAKISPKELSQPQVKSLAMKQVPSQMSSKRVLDLRESNNASDSKVPLNIFIPTRSEASSSII